MRQESCLHLGVFQVSRLAGHRHFQLVCSLHHSYITKGEGGGGRANGAVREVEAIPGDGDVRGRRLMEGLASLGMYGRVLDRSRCS